MLALLWEADGGLSHRKITVRIMQAHGLNLADRALCQTMRDWVEANLRGMWKRGRLVARLGRRCGRS